MNKSAPLNLLLHSWARFSRDRRPSGTDYPIGVLKADRLGDFLLAAGTIERLIRTHGADSLLLYVSEASQEAAACLFPQVARCVLPLAKTHRILDLRRELAQRRSQGGIPGVRQLLCLRHVRSVADEWLMLNLPAREVVAVRNAALHRKSDGEWVRARFEGDLTFARRTSSSPDVCSDLVQHAALLQGLGIPCAPEDLRTVLPKSDRTPEPTLLLAPLGSHPIRDLTLTQIQPALRLAIARGLTIQIPVARAADTRGIAFCTNLQQAGIPCQLRVTASFEDLRHALGSCRVLLATESAPAHLATALDQPLVALLGGGTHGLFAPWKRSPRQTWLTEPMACYGCNWSCIHARPLCLQDIHPQQVEDAVRHALDA